MKYIKNYILFTSFTVILVVIIMSVLSLFPPFNVYNVRLKQTNIYSSIVSDSLIRETFGLRYISQGDTLEYADLFLEDTTLVDVIPSKAVVEAVIEPSPKDSSTHIAIAKKIDVTTPILEDYSEGKYLTARLREKLASDSVGSVRIAFMGDSFIEGDILTMDLREMLQTNFSGGGIGYMPITSPVAKYRPTVTHAYSRDWSSNCIIQTKKKDRRYTLSGYEYIPSEGSWVSYETTSFRKHAAAINQATLLFMNPDSARITITINGGETRVIEPDSCSRMQQITINEPIDKIKYSFENCDNLIVYGAILDNVTDTGSKVRLDNYSIRGNSGTLMTRIDKELTAQYDSITQYSLIVIQYGLNVSGQDNYSYAKYGNQLLNVVNRLKECYPNCAIALLGVGDRCNLHDGVAVTMPSIVALDNIQRQVAQSSGVLYYSTLQAMQSMGGMGMFVENRWASKDYTHINAIGGKMIAEKLYTAITNDNQ